MGIRVPGVELVGDSPGDRNAEFPCDSRHKDREGALRISLEDAGSLGVEDGGSVRVTRAGGSLTTVVEVTDTVQPGHVTLPNGYGVDYSSASGEAELTVCADQRADHDRT